MDLCILLPFLGYLIDTEMSRILIPPEKFDTLRKVENVSKSLQDTEQLIGKHLSM
jgi:hypothetical protein